MKTLVSVILFLATTILVAQPIPSHYNFIAQKDSLYYLLTDNSLLKFYSPEESGNFYLTNYIEGSFPATTKYILTNDHILLSYNDSIFYYLNRTINELSYQNVFVPGFTITSIYGFGSYFLTRTANTFNIYKIQNGIVTLVDDSLFTTTAQGGLFFAYPYIIFGNIVRKFVEGFGIYEVSQLSINTANNTGLTNNTLVGYYYWIYNPPFPPPVVNSFLHKTIIEEPSFPTFSYQDWGLNIEQLHCSYCTGTLIARENLYYMTWTSAIVTKYQELAYVPTTEDRAMITDYYIFLLGNDSLRYSKWNYGSTFYPFTWNNYTAIENQEHPVQTFILSQNYPNPFNPSTMIRVAIPERSFITLKVYDVIGNEVTTLISEQKESGSYEVEFDGSSLTSGIYFYKLQAGSFVETKKMILLK